MLLRLLLANPLLRFLLLGFQGLVRWASVCFLAYKEGPGQPSIYWLSEHSVTNDDWPGIEWRGTRDDPVLEKREGYREKKKTEALESDLGVDYVSLSDPGEAACY